MRAAEVLTEARRLGVVLELDGARIRARGPLTDVLRDGIRLNRDQLVAALRLRQIHSAMGLSAEDVQMVESVILSGDVSEIVIASAPSRVPA